MFNQIWDDRHYTDQIVRLKIEKSASAWKKYKHRFWLVHCFIV